MGFFSSNFISDMNGMVCMAATPSPLRSWMCEGACKRVLLLTGLSFTCLGLCAQVGPSDGAWGSHCSGSSVGLEAQGCFPEDRMPGGAELLRSSQACQCSCAVIEQEGQLATGCS